MYLDKIISLSNSKTKLRLFAMIRSLRATGSDLPVFVIPYDNDKFDLPENCIWWEDSKLLNWLDGHQAHKTMRKYQCLLTDNYQFVDSDVIFIRNPQDILGQLDGFITSCGHWRCPSQTYTMESLCYLQQKTTNWQKNIFNSGQFACCSSIYNFETLKQIAEDPLYKATCIDFKYHEQPGMNLLVHLSGIEVTNVTLPPYNMESTHAGDYRDFYSDYWESAEKTPYLIHWAGCQMNTNRPIDNLFFNYLTNEEKDLFVSQSLIENKKRNTIYRKLWRNLSRVKKSITSICFE